MITEYEEQCQAVEEAQKARVLIKENHTFGHCDRCEEERVARRLLESLPEHKENQKAWSDFMKDLVNDEEPIVEVSEFDLNNNVIL